MPGWHLREDYYGGSKNIHSLTLEAVITNFRSPNLSRGAYRVCLFDLPVAAKCLGHHLVMRGGYRPSVFEVRVQNTECKPPPPPPVRMFRLGIVGMRDQLRPMTEASSNRVHPTGKREEAAMVGGVARLSNNRTADLKQT